MAPRLLDGVTIHPGADTFARLAKSHSIIPVWCEVIADRYTPIGAFLDVVGEDPGFLLESAEGGERWGRYSFLGRNPLGRVVVRGMSVDIARSPLVEGTSLESEFDTAEEARGGALGTCSRLLRACRIPDEDELSDDDGNPAGRERRAAYRLPPLHSGLVGYLGYDVVREIESLGNPPEDDVGLPDAVLDVIGELIAFDHWGQKAYLVTNTPIGRNGEAPAMEPAVKAYSMARERLERLAADLLGGTTAPSPPAQPPTRSPAKAAARRVVSSETYQSWVKRAKQYIVEGDIFQVVPAQRFDLEAVADPFDVYRILRLLNPSPYLYFLRTPEATVVGASPELMVRLRDGLVVSRPIAGTRRRGETDDEDAMLEADLLADEKERAEHTMLVDLARNDVGRVARYGSVRVEELMTVERYSHVMHMTSQVTGELAEGIGPVDVLRATLPAGTLSGAPKVRAMQIIDELEATKRGVYGGVVGYLDFSGNMDTAIAIRTLVVSPSGHASVQAGGGIVFDSDPAAEDRESQAKAAAILAAVQAAAVLRQGRGRG